VVIGSEHEWHNRYGLHEVPRDKTYLTWFSTFPVRLGMWAFTYTEPGPSASQETKRFDVSGEALFDHLKRSGIF